MDSRCLLGIIIIITVIIMSATLSTLWLTINIIIIKMLGRASDDGFSWVWEGKEGATMVADPQLTYTNSYEELHVDACGEINAAESAQDWQVINSITEPQGPTKRGDNATCRNNNLGCGFDMLGKVASIKGTGVHILTIQSNLKNKEFSRPHPILAILPSKYVIGC